MSGFSNGLISIIEFIVALSLLAFFHEMGHFLASKVFGIEVEEFGFGLPPKAKTFFKIKETEFTLNWIPFGAFIRPKGENDPSIPGGLAAANPWKRFLVMVAGPVMNLSLGVLIFAFVFWQTGAPDQNQVVISIVNPGSPAAEAGIQEGDFITAVNGIQTSGITQVRTIVYQHLDENVNLTLQRGDLHFDVIVVPRSNPPEGEGAVGIGMANPIVHVTFFQSFPAAINTAGTQIESLIMLPIHLLQGSIPSTEARLVSPKGIYDIFTQVRETSQEINPEPFAVFLNLFWFFGAISIALGVTNLLPIPALDGGRILFLLPELLFRKRIPARYENVVHTIGFMLLLCLMSFLFVQDIINPVVLP